MEHESRKGGARSKILIPQGLNAQLGSSMQGESTMVRGGDAIGLRIGVRQKERLLPEGAFTREGVFLGIFVSYTRRVSLRFLTVVKRFAHRATNDDVVQRAGGGLGHGETPGDGAIGSLPA